MLLNIKAQILQDARMKHTPHIIRTLVLTSMLTVVPLLGHAACYAEYKAKRDNPLKLHYGVAELNDAACNQKDATLALAPRLAADNWVLLSIIGFVDAEELDGVKANAGDYFLRY